MRRVQWERKRKERHKVSQHPAGGCKTSHSGRGLDSFKLFLIIEKGNNEKTQACFMMISYYEIKKKMSRSMYL